MIKRQIVRIDEELCNGCGLCVTPCAEGAIEIMNGKARVISDDLCRNSGERGSSGEEDARAG